jgi:hypothetical protein
LCRELRTSGDARLARILPAVRQVMSLCRVCKEHYSKCDSLVSHSNDPAHLPAGLSEQTRPEKAVVPPPGQVQRLIRRIA